MAAEVLTDKPE